MIFLNLSLIIILKICWLVVDESSDPILLTVMMAVSDLLDWQWFICTQKHTHIHRMWDHNFEFYRKKNNIHSQTYIYTIYNWKLIQFQLFWFIDCQNKFYILLHLSDNNCLVGREREREKKKIWIILHKTHLNVVQWWWWWEKKKSIKKLGGKKMNEFTATVFYQ